MPLQLPNLDDRSYDDLVAEALTLIPIYAPEWTNHNASDPGITLIELFAYLTDMLLYRLNRVTNDNTRKFLKLLNGPDWVEPANVDLREEIRQAVLSIRERYRAVTAGDYEFLASESFRKAQQFWRVKQENREPLDGWWKLTGLDPNGAANLPKDVPLVARAHCVPQRNLGAGSEAERLKLKPEHVSVVIVPDSPQTVDPQPSSNQVSALFAFLDERRMLTTKLHVTGPFYAHISMQLVVARRSDALQQNLLLTIDHALTTFLNPMSSADAEGWPFGRDVFVSDVYQVLERVSGIDFITDIMLNSKCTKDDEKCVVADSIWHDNGNLVGLRIQEHHLPLFDGADVVIVPSDAFVKVDLRIKARAVTDQTLLNRAIKSALRELLHPARGGPGTAAVQATDIYADDLRVAIKTIAGVLEPISVALEEVIPAPALQQDNVRGPFLHVERGKVVDWHVQIEWS